VVTTTAELAALVLAAALGWLILIAMGVT